VERQRTGVAGLPNPAGAPGIFDLTDVNAKSAAIGTTNISFTTVSGHKNEAIVIHKNAILATPSQMQHWDDHRQTHTGIMGSRRTVCYHDECHKDLYGNCSLHDEDDPQNLFGVQWIILIQNDIEIHRSAKQYWVVNTDTGVGRAQLGEDSEHCEVSVRCQWGCLFIIRSSYVSMGYHCKEGPDNLDSGSVSEWINLLTVLNVGKLLCSRWILNWQ